MKCPEKTIGWFGKYMAILSCTIHYEITVEWTETSPGIFDGKIVQKRALGTLVCEGQNKTIDVWNNETGKMEKVTYTVPSGHEFSDNNGSLSISMNKTLGKVSPIEDGMRGDASVDATASVSITTDGMTRTVNATGSLRGTLNIS